MLPSEYLINPKTENQEPVPDMSKKNIEIPLEKVYLHLDRPYFSSGEDIWIKAYLVDALTNKLSDNSNNLYVELISPDSKIIKQMLLRMDKGTGAGDLHLEDSIASGNYQIRAYTSWMRNFGETFFFKKGIVIENRIDATALNQLQIDENNEKVDIQFFPEGGSLVENVTTVIGFKAVNSSGYGCNINGFVVSSQGDTVVGFTSTHFGMGSFVFISKPGLKYYAIGSVGNKISFKAELPTALKTGYSLNVSNVNKDFFQVNIKTNQATLDHCPGDNLIIIGKSHSSLCTTAKVKIRGTDNSAVLSKKEFPEGIAMLTLMDTTGKLYSEREFYICTKERYQINVVPDKKEYAPRQKVTLQISVKNAASDQVSANLSVAVVDGNQIKDPEKKQDIRSYLLLESEISGYIEQPSYYFDTLNTDRYSALDNLLLTQGWRNFVWNSIPDTSNKFIFPIEKGITLSGTLRSKWGNKPVSGAKITMALLRNDNPFYKVTQTDSKGKYYLEGLNFTGPQVISIRATDKKNNGIGLISLDSVYYKTVLVNYKSGNMHETDANKVLSHIEPYESKEISDYKEESAIKYSILKKYHSTDTITIGEVIINARRPEREKDDGHFRSYGFPDYSITVSERMSGSHDPIQLLQGRTEGLYITGDFHQGYQFIFHGQILPKGESPLFLLDEKEVDLSTISNLPIEAVDKIEYIKESGALALYGFRGSFGVISILTKRGINSPKPPVLNFITRLVHGYYQYRTFYTPKYNIPQSESYKPDLRATIYWEPNVITDKDGNATISFFNSDNKAIINVDVEGIVESGIPLVGRSGFKSK
jgi:hypothetical protein